MTYDGVVHRVGCNSLTVSEGGVKKHYVALDGWRGIAALMVALFHFEALGRIHGSTLVHNSGLFVDFFLY
jgi:peptidoglycan/LPS O-acetylase OafA/YrhL